MKLFAPKYYRNFVCIADKCTHSCCVGWEIDVDENTLDKYATITHPYGDVIRSNIDNTDYPHFKLLENDRCPHLDHCGLCKIIKNLGEDFLCDICREHPRFYNFTNRGKEVGLGLSCEEACRIILSSDDFDKFDIIDEIQGQNEICDFDAITDRDYIFCILKNSSLSFCDKIATISDKYDINTDDINLKETLSLLEYLDISHRDLFLLCDNYTYKKSLNEQLTRLFAYFIYRHSSEAIDVDEFKASVGFALLLTKLISSISDSETIENIARIVSEEIEYSEENTEIIKDLFY